MLPLTLLAPQKVVNLLTVDSALQSALNTIATLNGQSLPPISQSQILISSLSPDIADKNAQLMYPRICIYSSQAKNLQTQKFRSFSGPVEVTIDVWFSGNLLTDTSTRVHYYLDAVTSILQANQGDWGDGFFFAGPYNVQLQSAKAGGFGFVELARITCQLDAELT